MKTLSKTLLTAFVAVVVAGALMTSVVRSVEAACFDTPFLGEICTFTFNFCPKDFLVANGQLLSINQNQALFSLIGTLYGGDGITTFALPNLQGRTAVGTGQGVGLPNITLGQTGGNATTATVLAGGNVQVPATQLPFVGLTQCIAVQGIFPFQN
jgi:microcystin-dependent protein